MDATVVNKYVEPFDVYIGRGTKWGNPFPIGPGSPRAEVIHRYHVWTLERLKTGDLVPADFLTLSGKRLGCFCAPKACHGDVLLKFIKWAEEIT